MSRKKKRPQPRLLGAPRVASVEDGKRKMVAARTHLTQSQHSPTLCRHSRGRSSHSVGRFCQPIKSRCLSFSP